MSPLALLAFVSPIFGLRLDLDPSFADAAFFLPEAETSIAAPAETDVAPATATVEGTETTSDGEPTAQDDTLATSPEAVAVTATLAAEPTAPTAVPPPVDIAAEMARRARIGRAHKRLGIATWGAMTATVLTGTLQYANLYGFFSPRAETRCVRGGAFYGMDSCTGTPIPHVSTTALTVALYYTTFGLSYAMPDPIGLDQGDSESARTLRQHKRMRWVHFGGMALQGVLGAFVANPHWMGMNRADDYRALQALATVHLLSGYATYGVLTYTGARMAF